MKKMKYLVFSLLFAGSLIVNSVGVAQAGDLMISGFADIKLNLSDEAEDNTCDDPAGTPFTTNCTESQFTAAAEVDFEKTTGDITFRLDLDFPVSTSTAVNTSSHIEQANFSMGVFSGADLGLTFTAGIFNSPVGFEAQDAPDKNQVTNGQLFGLVPSNLLGAQLAGGRDMVSGSVIFANDWNDPVNGPGHVGEENTLGFTLGINPMPVANLSIGWLDSGILPTEAVLDVVLSGMVEATPEVGLHYAVEYLEDEVNEGYGLTVNATHGKHMLTVRYDTLETDDLTPATDPETSTLTVALICKAKEGLSTKLEWRSNDNDTAVTTVPDNDLVQLQFVAMF